MAPSAPGNAQIRGAAVPGGAQIAPPRCCRSGLRAPWFLQVTESRRTGEPGPALKAPMAGFGASWEHTRGAVGDPRSRTAVAGRRGIGDPRSRAGGRRSRAGAAPRIRGAPTASGRRHPAGTLTTSQLARSRRWNASCCSTATGSSTAATSRSSSTPLTTSKGELVNAVFGFSQHRPAGDPGRRSRTTPGVAFDLRQADVPPRALRGVQGDPPADAGRPARPVPQGPRGGRGARHPGLRTARASRRMTSIGDARRPGGAAAASTRRS